MPDEALGIPITYDRLKDRHWQYSHDGGMVASETFIFNEDGTVGNFSNNNERYWEIHDGVVSLLSAGRVTTVTFDISSVENGLLTLKGRHLPRPSIMLCLKERHTVARPQNNPTRDALATQINRLGWSIGEHTYGVPGVLEEGRAGLVIGKYCSIAGGVKISLGDHNVAMPSTFPFKAFANFWPHVPDRVQHHSTKGNVAIGNDVWIGTDAFIGSGVTIGDGAVIGAKAVVVKNVPPYGVAVGNPARVVRYRFSEDIIRNLLAFKWWALDDAQVDELLPVMLSGDMTAFLGALRTIRGDEVLEIVKEAPLEPRLPPTPVSVPVARETASDSHYGSLFHPQAAAAEPVEPPPEAVPAVSGRKGFKSLWPLRNNRG